MLVGLGHLGEVVVGPFGLDAHGLEPGQGLHDGGLRLAVEEQLALEVVVHLVLRDRHLRVLQALIKKKIKIKSIMC